MQKSSSQRLHSWTCRVVSRNFSSSSIYRLTSPRVVKENEVVLLKNANNQNAADIITWPLRPGKEHALSRTKDYQRDSFRHDDIIGKNIRDVVKTRKGISYRILEPTLAEYTDNSPRMVTPIYSQDANLIVSLLDLHPTVPGERFSENERLEIFEAGTGHGALTLNLARAIHASNTASPNRIEHHTVIESANLLHESSEYKAWRTTRRAVINTLDSCEAHSKFAEQVVLNYRHGMYYGDIDFHVGSIHAYIEKRLNGTANEPFLQHAILDLPATEEYFDILGRALKPNGTLLTFCPSITQICDGTLKARQNSTPLWLEKVVEIGGGIGVGGREWDVRPVKPRATMKTEECPSTIENAANGGDGFVNQNGGWSMICRPKVGSRVVGGGFVAVWRRMADSSYSFVPKAV